MTNKDFSLSDENNSKEKSERRRKVLLDSRTFSRSSIYKAQLQNLISFQIIESLNTPAKDTTGRNFFEAPKVKASSGDEGRLIFSKRRQL